MAKNDRQPPRGSDGQFVKIPESMPEEHRPDTPGDSAHVYLDESDAREVAKKIPDVEDVKTVKRNGRVEYHLREIQEETNSGVTVRAKVTRRANVSDLE